MIFFGIVFAFYFLKLYKTIFLRLTIYYWVGDNLHYPGQLKLALRECHSRILLHLLSKNLFTEQILLKWRASIYRIDFLEWYTWQDENSKYWWVFIGLICKSVRSLFAQRITSTSEKLILSKDYSAVNFIVGWQLLSILKEYLSFPSPRFQIIKILSV